MNRLGCSAASHDDAWGFLRDELKADLCLVQEALPPAELRAVFRRDHCPVLIELDDEALADTGVQPAAVVGS